MCFLYNAILSANDYDWTLKKVTATVIRATLNGFMPNENWFVLPICRDGSVVWPRKCIAGIVVT